MLARTPMPEELSGNPHGQERRRGFWADRSTRWWRWAATIVAILIVLRLALPYAIAWQMNRQLAQAGSYQGHVDGVSLSLWRGAYQVHALEVMVKRDDGQVKPLFAVDRLDISLAWRPLLHGRIRGSLTLERPQLVIAPSGPANTDVKLPQPADPPDTAAKPPVERWQDRVGAIVAFRIDALRIKNGSVHYLDDKRSIDLRLGEFHGIIRDLAGGGGDQKTPATFDLRGTTTGDGRLHIAGKIEPWAHAPTFDIRTAIENVHLVAFNASAKHLNGLTFRSGIFSAYAETKAADGGLDGYIKPMFVDLDVETYGTDHDSGASKLFWKTVIVVAENVLPNDDSEALAARIPIHGRFDDPETDVWTVIGSVLGNAFLSAILPGFEGMPRFTSS